MPNISLRSHHRRRGLLALALAAALLAQSVVAARAGILGDFTVQDELELGEKFNVMIKSRLPLIEDPEIKGYVEDVVERLAENMPAQPFDLKVNVIKHRAVNAFAAPAGYIFVHSGLILNFEHESELAGVLAHELAHVSQRHIARRIERAQTMSLATLVGMLAGMFLGSTGSGEAGEALVAGSVAANQAAQLKYSREDETEADSVGMRYLLKAGYPPQGLASGFRKIQRLQWISGGGDIPTYLSTHPGVSSRIGSLEHTIERLPEDVRTREHKDSRFLRVQTLLRARYTDPRNALGYYANSSSGSPCLDTLGKAIVLDRLNRVNDARKLMDQALACGGADPIFLREAGRFFYEHGEFDSAALYLQQAVLKNHDDLMALFFFALLLGEQGETSKAVEYFERILRHLPEDAEVHYHYGRMLGEAGLVFKAHLHLSYSALYRQNEKKLDFHLDKARRLAATADQEEDLEELNEEYKKRKEYWDE
jgi:predicted Zn-dependent protease